MWGVLILGVLFRGALTQISDENLGWNFVNEYNDKVGSLWNENVKKAWNYYTNITDYNLEVMVGSIKSSALNGTASIYFLIKGSPHILENTLIFMHQVAQITMKQRHIAANLFDNMFLLNILHLVLF